MVNQGESTAKKRNRKDWALKWNSVAPKYRCPGQAARPNQGGGAVLSGNPGEAVEDSNRLA